MMSCSSPMPLIWAAGSALYVPPCHISAYCNLTLEDHPLGEQTCKLKFGSWVYDGLIMDVQLDGVSLKLKQNVCYKLIKLFARFSSSESKG